jgi:hypothetical protein
MKTPQKRRDGVRPAVPPDVESRPISVGTTPSRSRGRVIRRWPTWIITIQGEQRDGLHCIGISDPGHDIPYQGVRYPRHDTYLWGAAADDGRAPAWLTDAETHGMDKRPLAVEKILDWLLDLPRQFRKAAFVMFSFRYDIAQILKHLDYYTVWEIFKHETHPDKGVKKQIGHAPVFWKGYAIQYIDGKYIDIKRLANPDKPSQGGRSKYSASIRIYDVFGFWGSSFSAVVDSMVQSGRATSDEAAFVREMKGRRENFGSEDIGRSNLTPRWNCGCWRG